MTVQTNNKPRPIISGYDLPEKVKAEFDYHTDLDNGRFFKYKGNYYDIGEATVSVVEGWDGQYMETAFSAIVIRMIDDNDSLVVGELFS